MNAITISQKVLDKEIQALIYTRSKINSNMIKAVNLINKKRGKIIVSGIGKSGIIAQKLASTLSSTGIPSLFIHPVEALHGDIGILEKNDVGFFISNSGETKEILNLLFIFKKRKNKVIGLTGKTNSSLSKHSDVVLDGSVIEEACPFNIIPTCSTIVAMALGDAFTVSLMKKYNFSLNNYKKFHPSGSIGKNFLKVKDLMFIENLPKILCGSLMKEVIINLASTSLGAVVIVNKKDIIKGIYTDGDLKRTFKIKNNFLTDKIDNFMTKNPVIIKKDVLAIKALKLMKDKQISVLPVINRNKKIIGLINIHLLLN